MIPGPVDITEDVRQAMAVPAMPHYGTEWVRFFGETREMAKQVFGTLNDLYVMCGPGTMALEAAMASALEIGDTVLVPYSGFFSERLGVVAAGDGLNVVHFDVPAGQPVLPEQVADAFEVHPEIKALVVVHHETSTGVLNPLEEIVAVARSYGALVIVDAVSSLGGVPLPVDAWGIDLCVTVANKMLETPPGVSLISISPRAWQMIEQRQSPRGWYLDLKTWRWYATHWSDWHPTPATMPTSNINALNRGLALLLDDGLEVRYAAQRAAAQAVRRGLQALGFPMLVEEKYASPLTTACYLRAGVAGDALVAYLADRAGILVSGGIGDLSGKILRVGHIGAARKRDYIVALLLAVEEFLREHGEDVPPGASLVALDGVES